MTKTWIRGGRSFAPIRLAVRMDGIITRSVDHVTEFFIYNSRVRHKSVPGYYELTLPGYLDIVFEHCSKWIMNNFTLLLEDDGCAS